MLYGLMPWSFTERSIYSNRTVNNLLKHYYSNSCVRPIKQATYATGAEQYPNNVVIPQYCFLIPSNFMNTVILQSTGII